MGMHVCNLAALTCSFGLAPNVLIVLPKNQMLTSYMPAANIMDHVPMVNIMPFGMCTAPTNPAVIATTAAAMGVPTPAPCIPATALPWAPGSPTVMLSNMPALNDTSKLMCTWGGVISVTVPGQFTEQIP